MLLCKQKSQRNEKKGIEKTFLYIKTCTAISLEQNKSETLPLLKLLQKTSLLILLYGNIVKFICT